MSDSRRNISAWMRFQSYLTDVVLEKVPSTHSQELELILRNNRLILQTPKVFYSYEDLYGSYQEAFAQAVPFEDAENLLVLGFGMGSIPIILQRHHQLLPQITGLEIDREIISLAKDYLDAPLLSRLELLQKDARAIHELSPGQFSLVCVDVFLDDVVPADLSKPKFLKNLRARVAPGGQLYFSRLDKDEAFARNFKMVFPGARILQADQNQVWYWECPGKT